MSMDKIEIKVRGKTSEESNLQLISSFEKQFNTGPIIGEAKELLFQMANNIFIRDILFDSMGVDIKEREHRFKTVQALIEEKDEEILKKREENKCKKDI